MRGLYSRIAAMALVSAGVGGIMSGGAGRRRFVRNPAEPRDTKTERARKEARRKDPFFGIASRGRTGAGERMREMESARLTRGKLLGRGTSNPFTKEARKAEFDSTLKLGWSRNRAAKFARRVSPDAPARAGGEGRPVPVHASGGGAPRPLPNPPHRSGGGMVAPSA